jgi:putative ABC transport system permease protein
MWLLLTNALAIALREIRRNVLRSSLTTLGIVIGVAAVIVMVTLGSGATAQVTSEIASLGSNRLTIMAGQRRGPGMGALAAKPFTLADVAAVRAEVRGIRMVAGVATRSINAISGNRSWSTMLTGTTGEYLSVFDWGVSTGRLFTDAEERAGQPVCLVGATVQKELFGGQTALGSRLRLGTLSCEIVGMLAAKSTSAFGQDRDDTVIVPLTFFQRRVAGNDDVRQMEIAVREDASMDKVTQDLSWLLRERRRLAATAADDFSVLDMQDIASTVGDTTQTLTMLLAAVASVSLLVGGIGIMNIMLVSVTERTREIGIRLAIGAFEREVLAQFMVEAVVLASLGGLLGVALAIVASVLAADAIGVPFVLDVSIVALAVLFSAGVGVVFGFFPARRAARMNPIDALRHE